MTISNAGTITGNYALTLSGAGSMYIGSGIGASGGTGTLSKNDAGMVTLAGSNTSNGTTTSAAGVLDYANKGAMRAWNNAAGSVTVTAGHARRLCRRQRHCNTWTAANLDTLRVGTSLPGKVTWSTGSLLGIDTTVATGGSFTYTTRPSRHRRSRLQQIR